MKRRDAGDFDRVLKAQEQASGCALVRFQSEQILTVESRRTFGHLVTRAPREHVAERRFARSVRAHDRVHFAREVLKQLPMEFAVEAQKLLGISLEGSVG